MTGREEFGQDTMEELQFARGTNDFLVNHPRRVDLVLNAVKQKGVLANLAQLHELVAQSLHAAGFAKVSSQLEV